MFVTRWGVLEKLDEGRKGWKVPHAPAGWSSAPPAGLPVLGSAGPPPALGREEPGKRDKLSPARCCADAETPSPLRHRAVERSPKQLGLAAQTESGI
jgi:hypothetical protein